MDTGLDDYLQADGKQVEIELDKVRIYQEKTKGQSRQTHSTLLVKCLESLEAAPPTRFIYVVLWEDNGMFPTDCLLFSLREPSRIDVCTGHRWQLLGVYLHSTALQRL